MEAAIKLPPYYAGLEGCAALGGWSTLSSPRFVGRRLKGRGEGSRGMGVPGGDVHPPAVWRTDAGEPLLLWAGAGVFCAGPGGSGATGRSGAKKGGRIRYGEGALGNGTGQGGRSRSPEGAERP
jgi:hypothetical protein